MKSALDLVYFAVALRRLVASPVCSFRGGGGGTTIYWLYGYVPLERVWFSSHLVWYRVPYNGIAHKRLKSRTIEHF